LGWRPDSCCRVPCSVSRPSRSQAVAVAQPSVELQALARWPLAMARWRATLHAFGIVRLSAVGHWLTLGWRPDSCCRVPCSVSRPSRWRAVAVARSSVELQVRVVCACNSSGRRVTRSAKRMAARAAWTGGCKTAQGMASSARGCEQRSSVGHSRARSSERGLAVGDHRAVSVGAAVS